MVLENYFHFKILLDQLMQSCCPVPLLTGFLHCTHALCEEYFVDGAAVRALKKYF